MAKPRGAMGSPFIGFEAEMMKSGAFGTVGTQQNLRPFDDEKPAVVESTIPKPTVIAQTNVVQPATKLSSNEIGTLIIKLSSIGKLVSADENKLTFEIDGIKVNVTKE